MQIQAEPQFHFTNGFKKYKPNIVNRIKKNQLGSRNFEQSWFELSMDIYKQSQKTVEFSH